MTDKPLLKNNIEFDDLTKPCGVIHFFCPKDKTEDMSIYGKISPYENKEGFITLMVDPRYEYQDVLNYIKGLRLDKELDYYLPGPLDYEDCREIIDSFMAKVSDDQNELSDYERGKQDAYMEISSIFYTKSLERDKGIVLPDNEEEW